MHPQGETCFSDWFSRWDDHGCDPSEFVKKGKESVGVAKQYCSALGKVEKCQSGVFTGYSSNKGYGLLTCRLYMPESWFTKEQEQRRKANLVPEDLVFETKQQIALKLLLCKNDRQVS